MTQGLKWIVSPRFDGFFLIASPLVAVAFYAIYLGTVSATGWTADSADEFAFLLFLLFTGLFDAPHIFQTFARTHLDEAEYRRHRLLHWTSLAVTITVSIAAYMLDWSDLFLSLLSVYGAWHIIKQNVGFVRIYQKTNRHLEPRHSRLETRLLPLSLIFYYLHGHSDFEDLIRSVFAHVPWFNALSILQLVSTLTVITLMAIVFWRNFQVFREKGQWNSPKMAMIASSLILVFWLSLLNAPPLLLIAISTIGHNIQYQAWMWIYNQRRTRRVLVPSLALAGSLALGIMMIMGSDLWAIPYNGVVLWHYFIDGHIWHFGAAPELVVMLESGAAVKEPLEALG
ncbi:MAG: hypothetical protein KF789_00215 [Bdellovibrionaceae bacterium]|nr:hypothetical protein [Pseudobdellovibrionaceae bacterium]